MTRIRSFTDRQRAALRQLKAKGSRIGIDHFSSKGGGGMQTVQSLAAAGLVLVTISLTTAGDEMAERIIRSPRRRKFVVD